MFQPPPFNPTEPCELIAENTFEALRIVRQGEWVYKFLRPHDSFPGQTADDRRRQIRLRVKESHRHEELNPLAYVFATNCLVARYISGRHATTREAYAVLRHLVDTGRNALSDITPQNIRMIERRPLVIDFAITINART